MTPKAKILVDSCYWIALYNPQETDRHTKALHIVNDLENNTMLIPWPTLYEFVNTKLSRRKESLYSFQKSLLKENVYKVSDENYKESALENIFELNKIRINTISLIDEIIRQMISDRSLQVDYLVTFNKKDFEYICQLNGVIILE